MRGFKLLPVVLLAGLVWFLFVSERGSQWLADHITVDENAGKPVGRIVSTTGPFKIVHGGTVEEYASPLTEPVSLAEGNRLETPKGTSLLLVLSSTDELEIGELSAVSVQLWNPRDAASPIYVQWQNGAITARKTGPRGRAYLVKDGRLYFPGQKAVGKPLALTVLRSAPIDMQLAGESGAAAEGGGDFETDTTPEADAESAVAPTAGFTGEPESLSNEYIDEMIAARQAQLQKCWLTGLKDNPGLKGQLTLQFEISRRGKVRELKVTDSTLKDPALERCVLSVIERISFRSYRGQEISLSYPITFE